jgi:hypothetical protein
VAAPDDVIARIVAAKAADAAAMVLALHWQQSRTVLAALGPREVARLLRGVRADRVAELMAQIPPGLLPAVLAQLALPDIAQLVPLLAMDGAVRVVQSLSPADAAELVLMLPTAHRMALQAAVPSAPVVGSGGYASLVEQAVRRNVGQATWADSHRRSLVTEVFGRSVQVVAWDRPGGSFGPGDLQAAIGATDLRPGAVLVVLTNATLEPTLPGAVREARAAGYTVEPMQWIDERDDGALKRTLVRLAS